MHLVGFIIRIITMHGHMNVKFAYNCTYEPRSEKRLAYSQYYQTKDTHYGSCVVGLTGSVRQEASSDLNAT